MENRNVKRLIKCLLLSWMIITFNGIMANESQSVNKNEAFTKAKLLQLDKDNEITAPTASLIVDKGDLITDLEVSITSIQSENLPKLEHGMTNVTDSFSGYRFLPHGEHFTGKGAKVVLGYDRTKIPSGYTEDDIHTYYYNEQTKSWVALQRDSIDRKHRQIISRTTHFTDMINGVIQAPESPETQGFAPTMMSDLQAADPTSKIQMIEAPQPNSTGSASLSYSFEMPPAPHNLTANLGIQYSSDAGSGWLGEGWNLITQSITVDTRWGVPRYDSIHESETYLMDGLMLIEEGMDSPAHRNYTKDRKTGEVKFYPRKESAFSQIVRIGDSPSNYRWIVSDRRGTKYYYGDYKYYTNEQGEKDSTLTGVVKGKINHFGERSDSVISEWHLTKIENIYHDYVKYVYRNTDEKYMRNINATSIYLDSIYVGSFDKKHHTAVVFHYNQKKKMVRTNANYGFLMMSNKLLTDIDIYFEDAYLRGYKFTYLEKTPFNADLLQKLSHLNSQKEEVDSHIFSYENNVASENYNEYYPFKNAEAKEYETGSDEGIRNLFNFGSYTPLGGTFSVSKSFNTYIGAGLSDGDLTSKSLTAGFSYSHGVTDSWGEFSFTDINGDGLPDKVIKSGKKLYYRKNLGNNSFSEEPIELKGAPSEFAHSTNRSNNFGGKVHIGISKALIVGGGDKNFSDSETDTYFSDVNADGLIDIVYEGVVYFNNLDKEGNPTFSTLSKETPNPINAFGTVELSYGDDEASSSKKIEEKQNKKAEESPLQDIVRVWVAPKSGKVVVLGDANLVVPSEKDGKADGAYVSIQKGNKEIRSKKLTFDSPQSKFGDVEVDVNKDDKIYFRVQSGRDKYSDGNQDVVIWKPIIKYGEDAVYGPDKYDLNLFESSESYLFSSKTEFNLDTTANSDYVSAVLTGLFSKEITSDSIEVSVVLYNDSLIALEGNKTIVNPSYKKTILYNHIYGGNEEIIGESIDLNNLNLLEKAGLDKSDKNEHAIHIGFQIMSKSNVDFNKISWIPKIKYTNSKGEVVENTAFVYYRFYNNVVNYETSPIIIPELHENVDSAIKALDSLKIIPVIEDGNKDFQFSIVVKGGNNQVYKRCQLSYTKGNNKITPEYIRLFDNDFIYNVGEKIWVEFYSDSFDVKLNKAPSLRFLVDTVCKIKSPSSGEMVDSTIVRFDSSFPVSMYSRRGNEDFGPMFRNWGWFGYNNNQESFSNILDESKLGSDQYSGFNDKFDEKGNLKEGEQLSMDDVPFVVLRPDAELRCWVGMSENSYLYSDTMKSSRLGNQSVIVEDPLKKMADNTKKIDDEMGTGAAGICITSEAESTTFMAGGGAFGQSLNVSTSNGFGGSTQLFTDMNGDGYPDIISEDKIQYTNVLGGLANGGILRNVNALDHSVSEGNNIGLGGGPISSEPGSNQKNAAPSSNKKVTWNSMAFKNASVNVSQGGGEGNEKTEKTMMDINGDGLADIVFVDDKNQLKVRLNYGYSFSDEFNFGTGYIREGKSTNFGLGGGVDIGASSYSAGASRSGVHSEPTLDIRDVNGDGLPDLIKLENNEMKVQFNNGTGFDQAVKWNGISSLSSSASFSQAVNANVTAGFSVWLLKIVGTGGGSIGTGVSGEYSSYQDVDGDGFADILEVENRSELANFLSLTGIPSVASSILSKVPSKLIVKHATIGATNKLKSVTNPFGGTFTIDYTHTQPTTDHPCGKWAMSALEIDDATGKNAKMRSLFKYENGKRDRRERDFLGFGKVFSYSLDGNDTIRTTIQEYDVSHYLTAGAITRTLITDKDTTQKYREELTSYKHYEVSNGSELTENDNLSLVKSLLSVPASKTSIAYEKNESQSQEQLPLSKETYEYTTSYGNIKSYQFNDLTNNNYGYTTTIDYADYKLGTPNSVVVKGSDGIKYREVTATYNNTFTPWAMTSITQVLNNEKAKARFEYDHLGNLTKKTLPAKEKNDSMSFSYTYDRKYNMYPERVEDAFGYRSEMEDYDYRYGIPRTVRDMNGYTVQYHVDDLGRVDTIVAPNEQSDGVPYTISYQYNDHGDYTSRYAITNHYDPQHPDNPIQTITHVDGLGRPYQVKKETEIYGDGVKYIVSGLVKYDGLGRTTKTYHPFSCSLSDFSKIVSEETELMNTTVYDAIDRPLTQSLPEDECGDESVTHTSYSIDDNLLKTTIKAPNQNEQYSYTNGAGQTVRTARELDGEIVPINYFYDPIGQLDSLIDAGGNVTRYTYDMAGRKLSVSHPSAGLTTFTFDIAGNMTERQTSNLREDTTIQEHVIKYTYDKNRLTKIEYPQHPENNVTYTYGGVNAPYNRVGRVALVEDASGAVEYYYGKMGEVTKQRRTLVIPNVAVATYTTQWKYDSHNRLLEMIYPDEEKIKYSYNFGGQLSSVVGEKSYLYRYIDTIGYDMYEQKKYMKYGNGTETTYDYSSKRRRLKNVAVTSPVYGASKIMDNTYSYDEMDNIVSLVNNAVQQNTEDGKTIGGQVTQLYTYDSWSRLIKAVGKFTAGDKKADYELNMGYDKLYNITSKQLDLSQENLQFDGKLYTGHDFTYNYDKGNPFKLENVMTKEYATEQDTTSDDMFYRSKIFEYDSNGNLTKICVSLQTDSTNLLDTAGMQVRQMLWDEENRLLAINDNGYVSNYFYDSNGERTVKISALGEQLFVNSTEAMKRDSFPTKFVAYVSPYLVVKNGGEYTKHIYAGTQRIASKIGDLESFGADPRRVDYAGADIKEMKYKQIYKSQNEAMEKRYEQLKAKNNLLREDDYVDGKSFCCSKQIAGMDNNLSSDGESNPQKEQNIYFYHPDHLGSTNVVTDYDGRASRVISYIPYGEIFVEQQSGGWQSPYLFNAKELDSESGLYYYGARYLDPSSAAWLSVDPLWEKYVGMSPYGYCAGNPVRLVDVDGKSTHISEDGTVIGVNNDNDLGVYINTTDKKDKPKFIFKEYKKLYSDKEQNKVSYIGGEKIGETEYWDEFISPETGEIYNGIKIHKDESFDEIVERYHDKAKNEDLRTVASKSAGKGEYDVKYHLGMYGAKLEGKYVTTRSVGNYLAAYNAATCTYFKFHISFETFQKLAGALHIEESHGKHLTTTQKASIVLNGTYSGCSDEKAFKTPPTYGEVYYQYRMSKKGWNHAK